MLLDAMTRLWDHFYKPEFDAGRARRVYREYAIGRRYGEYHACCQAQFKR